MAAKKQGGKAASAMAEAMRRRIEAEPALTAARQREPQARGVLDMEKALIRARIERAARAEPPFSPRTLRGRAQITLPLIERLIQADAEAVARGDMEAAKAMGSHHQAAADEIRFIHALRCDGAANISAVDWTAETSRAMVTPAWPAGGAGSERCDRLYRACLLPWVEAMQAAPPQDGKGRPLAAALTLTVRAVLTSPPLRELERMAKLRNGQARAVIRESLRRYTTMDELMQMRGKRGKTGV